MNLRAYFEAIRRIEAEIEAAECAIVSCETADGGRAGVRATVPRRLAAMLIVDGKAVLAAPEPEHRGEKDGAREDSDAKGR
jgi:hypothetical protein